MFFPIPPASSGDENFSNVRLLLRMNGSHNGTIFTDESNDARSITRAGGVLPVTDTGVKTYGTASAQFPTNSSSIPAQLRVTASSIGTGQFTLETWLRISSTATLNIIADTRYNSSYAILSDVNSSFLLMFSPAASNKLRFQYYVSNVATYLDSTTTLSTNTWYHCAVCRNADNLVRLFLDGNLENSATITNNWTGIYWVLGGMNAATNHNLRYLDDLRLTTEVCRYTDTFTPPNNELPVSNEIIRFPQSVIEPVQIPHSQHQLSRLGL